MAFKTKGLTDKLTTEECNHSLFEDALRRETAKVLPGLLENGELAAISFSARSHRSQLAKDVLKAFPKLCKDQAGKVLEGKPAQEKVSGKKIAVLFSGGPAAGGHNVILGIKKILGKDNILYGIKAGPKGLLAGDLFELTDEMVENVRNLGGFDLLGSDRTKIKTTEQFEKVRTVVKKFKLDGIIIIGGDDSNTNAALIAEYLFEDGCAIVGVPKTIDGDLQAGKLLPISFGFDTATKIYSELVGNILQDTPSSRKYWHFIKLMGRSASQVALEVALQTKPTVSLISEEVAERQMSLADIISEIADIVVSRAKKGINHGVVLIPEGLIEFIPEFKPMIAEINDIIPEIQVDLESMQSPEKISFVVRKLSKVSANLLNSLPLSFAEKFLLDRDSHGNLQVSLIETEKLIAEMVKDKVNIKDAKCNTQTHFFGYEGRCGAPSRFDQWFTYNLGLIAGALVLESKTGYMAAMADFETGGKALAVPLVNLINIERRHGKEEMVIEKALVKTDSPAFKYFQKRRDVWAKEDRFSSPGPRQMWGDNSYQMPILVALNQGYQSLGMRNEK